MQKPLPATPTNKTIRLNKYLAQFGIASRRKIDELIERNQVWVNERRASLGMKIDPANDSIKIGKKLLSPQTTAQTEYWLVNKPVGYVSTTYDEAGRPTVLSLVKESKTRLFPVGRLDLDSEGLVILTNDGELTQRLTHPSHHVPKTYRVWVRGRLTDKAIDRIKTGLRLKHQQLAPAKITVLEQGVNHAVLDLTLYQGVNRQVRRMMKALNLTVARLLRISLGPLKLASLPTGEARPLKPAEVSSLKKL